MISSAGDPNRVKALLLNQNKGETLARLETLDERDLPPGDVVVSVAYSSLNYKDALAVTGKGKIVRYYPMVPGIDLAGIVEKSDSPEFSPGDPIILTGYGVGEDHWGGFAQKARVRAEWLVPLPRGLTLQQSMAIGTAGFTAMQCVMALEEHGLQPGSGDVIVTGASGGVGSISIAILAKKRYRVVASTGKKEAHDYLRELGAAEIWDRNALLRISTGKPLESQKWNGAIDTVGGETLAVLLSTMKREASVAACGLAGGSSLHTTIFPFILRGVNLLGISSVYCSMERRREVWKRLTQDLPLQLLERMTHMISLEEVPKFSEKILRGEIQGRTVIRM